MRLYPAMHSLELNFDIYKKYLFDKFNYKFHNLFISEVNSLIKVILIAIKLL
jgi:hypothetical protein